MTAMHQPCEAETNKTATLVSMIQAVSLTAPDQTIANCTKSDYPRWVRIGKMQSIRDSVTRAMYQVKPCVMP